MTTETGGAAAPRGPPTSPHFLVTTTTVHNNYNNNTTSPLPPLSHSSSTSADVASSSSSLLPSSPGGATSSSVFPSFDWSIPTAAAAASASTKALLHPIDTFKSRAQAVSLGSWSAFRRHWAGQWSLAECYAGLPVKMCLYAPYQSLYMTTYDRSKTWLEAHPAFGHTWRTVFASALMADLASMWIRVPMEAIKMRQQCNVYRSAGEAASHLRSVGWVSTVRRLAFPQLVVHDIPYSIVQWSTFEHLRPRLQTWLDDAMFAASSDKNNKQHQKTGSRDDENLANNSRKNKKYSSGATFIAGLLSGSLTGLVTTPCDVIKTRVVVESASRLDVSVSGEMKWLYSTRGLRGFFRGASVRILWIASNMAVYLVLFDVLKKTARHQHTAEEEGSHR